VHRDLRSDLRRGLIQRDRTVRPEQRSVLPAFPETPARYPPARHLQSHLRGPGQGRLANCFLTWVRSLELPEVTTSVETTAVDGKTVYGSGERGFAALHTVSAWASEHGVVLAQTQVNEKSNKITVIPSLLDTLSIAGATVTVDVMGAQKRIAWTIREHHAA
jgi:hypothetical protein